MSSDMEDAVAEMTLGAEYDRAPAWARALAVQQRKDRHDMANALAILRAEQKQALTDIGGEPDTEGHGGRGLIGEVRRTRRDLDQLLGLKKMGIGFIAAVSLFGAIILLGIVHWVQQVAGASK